MHYTGPATARLTNRLATGHPVFDLFKCWNGIVPENRIPNFLGVMTNTEYGHPYFSEAPQAGQEFQTDYPKVDEEYFEWIDVLEAVVLAESRFTMFELGAGWGRWTACAAAALRQYNGLPHTLVAVEAEPSHFKWMTEHLAENGLERSALRLIQAAVSETDGKIGFHVGKDLRDGNWDWYGQAIGGSTFVDSVSLKSLLAPFETIDLIDLDVQGAEANVLGAAREQVNEKVKRVHVGTHSRAIERELYSLFSDLGWHCLCFFEGNSVACTEWGTVSFQDGVQSWLNPRLSDIRKQGAEVLARKLLACRDEIAALRSDLESARSRLAYSELKFLTRARLFIYYRIWLRLRHFALGVTRPVRSALGLRSKPNQEGAATGEMAAHYHGHRRIQR